MKTPFIPSRLFFLLGLGLALAPAITVRAASDAPRFKESEYRPAGLGPREPGLTVDYPGAASVRGISHGRAEVNVLVGADGKPLDFLVTSETDAAFGRALLGHRQTLAFRAATLRGVPVPARCGFVYDFTGMAATGVNV